MSRQIVNAMDAGEGDLEIQRLRQRLARNERDLDARILLARAYSRRGVPDLAIEHYRLAAAQFPDSVVAPLELAKTLRAMGAAAEALDAAARFYLTHPQSWELVSYQGILRDELGQYVQAESNHRAALALAENRSGLHNNLGYNLMLQGKSGEAVTQFRSALELDPQSRIAHNNLGAALATVAHGSSKEALAELERWADPAVAHNNMAAVLIEEGLYAEARTELGTSLAMRQNLPAALSNLQLLSSRDGKLAVLPVTQKHSVLRRIFLPFSGKPSAPKQEAKRPSGSTAKAAVATR